MERLGFLVGGQEAAKSVLCIAELLELWFCKHLHTEVEHGIKAGNRDYNVARDDTRRIVRYWSSLTY